MPSNIPKPIPLAPKIISIYPTIRATASSPHSTSRERPHSDKTPFKPKSPVCFDPPPSRNGRDAHGLQTDCVEGVDLAAVDKNARG